MRLAQGGPQLVMLDIGPKPAFFDMNLTAIGMCAQQAASLLGGLGQQVNRAVNPNFEDIIFGRKAGKFTLIFQIGAKAAKTCLNHVAGFGVRFDITRQCQKPKCRLQIQICCAGALWQ